MATPNDTIRNLILVAAAVLVIGVIVVASQYFSRITGGASADVINIEAVPDELTMSKEAYQRALSLTDAYFAETELPAKNELMRELRLLLFSLAQ